MCSSEFDWHEESGITGGQGRHFVKRGGLAARRSGRYFPGMSSEREKPGKTETDAPAEPAGKDGAESAAEHEDAEEIGGPAGPEPTRYGDWEVGGRCTDF